MALAPADFYAYSRATGVPVPEDPEERAALAPEVLEFRRNQLRSPQSESTNPIVTGLGLGLAAAGLGLGALGVRSLLKGRKAASAPAAPVDRQNLERAQTVSPADVAASQANIPVSTSNVAPSAAIPQATVDLSTVAKRSIMPTEAEALQSYSSQLSQFFPEPTAAEMEALSAPSRSSRILARLATEPQYRPDPKDINYARFGPVSKEVAEARRTQAREDLLRFAQQRQEDAALSSQAMAALESGEDQMTGRVLRGVMRNEDLDASQVNQVARQTGSAEVAASMTPDGVPVDQTKLLPKKENVTFSEFLYTQPSQAIQDIAARTKARQAPTEVTLIGRYPAVPERTPLMPQGIFPGSLGESIGETVTFTPVNPYQGRTNVTRGGVEFTVQEGRIQGVPARTTILPRGTALEGLRGPAVPTVKSFDPEEAAAKLQEFQLSREMQIQNAMEKGLSEARARRNVQLSENQKAALESTLPSYSPEDVMSQPGLTAYGDVSEAERFSEEMASKSGRLKSLEEGGFLEEQIDPGQLRTEPRRVYPGVMIRPASRTSYRGMTGRPGVGIYGEQAPGRPGEPGFGAGAVEAKKEIKVEGEERGVTTPRPFTRGVDLPEYETPEGFVYTEEALTKPTKATGGYKRYGTQPPSRPETRLDSLAVSQELTRLQREGRAEEAQAFLDKIMQERGISNIGFSQPLRPQINRQGRF